MNKTGRLVRILILLQAYKELTAQELANKLEVAVRTIYRDIETLALWGVPIVASSGHRGGYSLPEGYSVDPDMFTSSQVGNLGTGGVALGRFTDFVDDPSDIEIANAKLLAVLPIEEQIIFRRQLQYIYFDNSRWYRNYVHKDNLRYLKQAVLNNKQALISFFERDDPSQQSIEEALVDPYGLVFKSDTWYLVGYTHSQKLIRRWNITRIVQTTIQDTEFTRLENFVLSAWWKDELEKFGQGNVQVLLSIRKSAWPRFSRVGWKSNNRFFDAGDNIVIELMVDKDEWLIDLVMVNRGDAEILSPDELREKIALVAAHIENAHVSSGQYKPLETEIIDFEALSIGKDDLDL
jgi:predicted DNA-binding transcriptional regulator YafY